MKRTAVLVLAAAAVAGCTSTAPRAAIPAESRAVVPAEFRAACGHPGVQVEVRKVPVTIAHTACDLTGVAISYSGRGGATVPHGGGGTGIGNSSGFGLTVHPGTLDVTITVTGPAGND